MSDAAQEGYICCEKLMEPITLEALSLMGPTAVLCQTCLKFRCLVPRKDSQLRALVVSAMERKVRKMYDAKTKT